MADATKIEWADSTFNPWIGCTKISPACDNCYAAERSARFGDVEWGNHPRLRTGEDNWKKPRRWQRQADAFEAKHGRARFVFCASLADVFDNQVPTEWRTDLWDLIRDCDRLTWLLLTKRPQNIAAMLPDDWGPGWPHVWLGATVENQEVAERNVPHLLSVPAAKRFLSIEPMLEPIDLTALAVGEGDLDALSAPTWGEVINASWRGSDDDWEESFLDWYDLGSWPDEAAKMYHPIDWVIAGGESGPNARPADPDWFRSLRDQCQAARVPFFFKQWGEWIPISLSPDRNMIGFDRTQGPSVYIPVGRGKPTVCVGQQDFARVGKKAAGRLLDGRTWSERP